MKIINKTVQKRTIYKIKCGSKDQSHQKGVKGRKMITVISNVHFDSTSIASAQAFTLTRSNEIENRRIPINLYSEVISATNK